jgi:hypothetical protein
VSAELNVTSDIASAAESNLLGALILRPDLYREAQPLVSEMDFQDARLGAVWSGVSDMIGRRMAVDQITVQNRFEEWGLRGLDEEVFRWCSATVYPFAIGDYAIAVRQDAIRRDLQNIVWTMGQQFRATAPAINPLTGAPFADGRLEPALQPSDVASEMHRLLEEMIDNRATTDSEVKTLRQVLLGVDTYDWVIPNFLERMERLVFTGGEGVGKTTLCRQIVVLAAAGIHPLTFQPMPPVRVLVVDAENSEKQWRRGVSWMAKTAAREGSVDPTDRIFIKAGKRIDITRGTELAKIHRYIDEYKPDIVYIGPIYKLVPGSLNSDEDAAKLIVALDSLRERNVALIMEAHAGKKTDFGGLRNLEPRGSSAILAWPEFGLGLRPNLEVEGLVDIVRWRGDRDDSRPIPSALWRSQPGQNWHWVPATN